MNIEDFTSGVYWVMMLFVASLFAYGLWADPVARVVFGSVLTCVLGFAKIAHMRRMKRERNRKP